MALFKAAAVKRASKYCGKYAIRLSGRKELSMYVMTGSFAKALLRSLTAFGRRSTRYRVSKNIRIWSSCRAKPLPPEVMIGGAMFGEYVSVRSSKTLHCILYGIRIFHGNRIESLKD